MLQAQTHAKTGKPLAFSRLKLIQFRIKNRGRGGFKKLIKYDFWSFIHKFSFKRNGEKWVYFASKSLSGLSQNRRFGRIRSRRNNLWRTHRCWLWQIKTQTDAFKTFHHRIFSIKKTYIHSTRFNS